MVRTDWAVATRNICLMHLVERLATRFNAADVPLILLKGAALNLTLYQRPDERPMSDVDLLIRPEHVEQTCELLGELGCRPGEPLVREDFFPRFHYETEFVTGEVFPLRIDLHVRPLRPLRYARLVPNDALWQRARPVRIGQATVLVPAPDDMLIHLAAHAAVHGFERPQWLAEIKRCAETWQAEIDWEQLVSTAESWRLTLPVREAFARVQRDCGPVCPQDAWRRLMRIRVSWRDRLALRQAPRDVQNSVAHVLVNVLCTPGWRFVCGYLMAVLVPDRSHMSQWYPHRHWGWLTVAHLARWVGPLWGAVTTGWKRLTTAATGGGNTPPGARVVLPRQTA